MRWKAGTMCKCATKQLQNILIRSFNESSVSFLSEVFFLKIWLSENLISGRLRSIKFLISLQTVSSKVLLRANHKKTKRNDDDIFLGGGQNVEFQNFDRPKISERWNGLFSWSEHRKSKRSERRKCLLSWSLLRHHNVENGFWVDHYIEKNEKNIENLNFVWFLHFNYLWRHFNYLWHMVLWTTGIKKWIFKNSLTWLNLT